MSVDRVAAPEQPQQRHNPRGSNNMARVVALMLLAMAAGAAIGAPRHVLVRPAMARPALGAATAAAAATATATAMFRRRTTTRPTHLTSAGPPDLSTLLWYPATANVIGALVKAAANGLVMWLLMSLMMPRIEAILGQAVLQRMSALEKTSTILVEDKKKREAQASASWVLRSTCACAGSSQAQSLPAHPGMLRAATMLSLTVRLPSVVAGYKLFERDSPAAPQCRSPRRRLRRPTAETCFGAQQVGLAQLLWAHGRSECCEYAVLSPAVTASALHSARQRLALPAARCPHRPLQHSSAPAPLTAHPARCVAQRALHPCPVPCRWARSKSLPAVTCGLLAWDRPPAWARREARRPDGHKDHLTFE